MLIYNYLNKYYMICDHQTNVVYLAEGIKHYMPLARNLMEALYQEGIETRLLRHTESKKHVWARDYMPVQLDEGRFLQYQYAPDYLKDEPDYIPPYQTICRGLHLKVRKTTIVIDGGNVVKFHDRVIMTDKVFQENPLFGRYELESRLEQLFGCEVRFIPWDRYEIFGHADGMVRAIGPRYVLLNNYYDFDREFRKKVLESLSRMGCDVVELHYDRPRPSGYSWAYLNFLQVGYNIFVPGLGIEEDGMALEQIQKAYPNGLVRLVPGCQDLVRDGGALNCISWTIKAGEAVGENNQSPIGG